jgi:hypothetical protein
MSSSTLPQSPAASNAMREQLDELDAILQRMLTLPVNGLSDADERPNSDPPITPPPVRRRPLAPPILEKPPLPETASSPPRVESQAKPRVEPPAKPHAPIVIFQPVSSPSTLSVPEPPPIAIATPPIVAPQLPTVPVQPASGSGPARTEAPQTAPESPKEVEPIVPPKASEFLERHRARLVEQRRIVPWLGPLGWLNAAFDRCSVALGRPGLWLVRSDVRTLMGWLGFGMLLAAAAILIGDWFGWTW